MEEWHREREFWKLGVGASGTVMFWTDDLSGLDEWVYGVVPIALMGLGRPPSLFET